MGWRSGGETQRLAACSALSFAEQVQRDLALVRTVAMLEEIDALPGTERQTAIDYRNR